MTNNSLRILVVSTGEFSGIKASLISTLRRKGCDVIEGKITLRNLRCRYLHILWMYINALLVYKAEFRRFLRRTYASYVTLSKASAALFGQYEGIDAVILIGANFLNFWKNRNRGTLYTIFTDHTNMLSQKLSDVGFQPPETKIKRFWYGIERRILQEQDHIFVMGSHVKRSMVEDYGINPTKITIVGGGPNLDLDIERDGVVKEYQEKNILFVGLDVERKGLKVLERAFAKVKTIFPESSLHVVGAEGASHDGITYYGRIGGESLRSLFYRSQIFALPTFREPFGIVFLEAMFAKNVCIGTNIEAVPEIILNGESGYVIEPNDDNMLADKIITLFSDRVLLMKMAEKGYQIATQSWSWDKTSSKMIQQLEKMTIKNA